MKESGILEPAPVPTIRIVFGSDEYFNPNSTEDQKSIAATGI